MATLVFKAVGGHSRLDPSTTQRPGFGEVAVSSCAEGDSVRSDLLMLKIVSGSSDVKIVRLDLRMSQ